MLYGSERVRGLRVNYAVIMLHSCCAHAPRGVATVDVNMATHAQLAAHARATRVIHPKVYGMEPAFHVSALGESALNLSRISVFPFRIGRDYGPASSS